MKLGPVDTSQSPYARHRTLALSDVRLDGGFWSTWQRTNHKVSLRHGFDQLERFGNFNNLKLAAGKGEGEYRRPVFMDSDVYKWLEAIGYELAWNPDPELVEMADHAIKLVEGAQGEDGYLNSYWDVVEPDRRWADLDHGHELYCAGHLFQAAVAYYRATGDRRLLDVSCRFADYIDSVFGPGKRIGTPGHPEVEMALVELFRETGERRYLDLALYFVDQRGHGLLQHSRFGGGAYYQDHIPVREASTVEGHAVRQLYLTTGVADLYLETGEGALLDALMRQWRNMTSRKLFITGGLGSQHAGEAFGEPYELPNERCYCETCAQIASIMWNWRMLLITGERRFADLLERTLYNGFLSGVSLDGRCYFYVNPLMSRGADPLLGRKHIVRPEWHGCACCPPNVMRTLSSLQHYLATTDESGVQIHQYAPSTIRAAVGNGEAVLKIETNYPWEGTVKLTVQESRGDWTLKLRIPNWSAQASWEVNGRAEAIDVQDGYATLRRSWAVGDTIVLTLAMQPTLIEAHPRVDPTRSSVAIERGPLVYCFEGVDQEQGVDILDAQIDVSQPLGEAWRSDLLGGIVTVEADGFSADPVGWGDSLYRPLGHGAAPARQSTRLTAIPYYAWANRGANPMRVWIPRSDR
ncbi:MAG: glycoside hydrolase family 127 protein [Caldilineaceae bacterium]|nr:glycoside hydrolase family 127 protein [Caldilineaceae bacterium]